MRAKENGRNLTVAPAVLTLGNLVLNRFGIVASERNHYIHSMKNVKFSA